MTSWNFPAMSRKRSAISLSSPAASLNRPTSETRRLWAKCCSRPVRRGGLTLEAISQESKIPVMTLQHLETDNFEAIPAKVYATGFLRTYGQILGLDPAQLINKYEIQTGQTHKSRGDLWEIEEEVVEEKLDSPHLFRKFVIPVIVVIGLIIVLWKIFGGRDEGTVTTPVVPEAAQVTGEDDSPASGNARGCC